MATLDELIAQSLQESLANGELRSAPSFGKPMVPDVGWEQTPEALRLPFKMLKDSGFLPPEVLLFHEVAELQKQLATVDDAAQRHALHVRISQLRQHLAIRLEQLRGSGSL